MTELKITQADIDRAHEWVRGQTTGLRMMLTKPRGIYEMLAAHRIAAEEGKAELVEAIQRWVDATDALAEFERDHPNDTTSRWDRLFDERGFASDALRAALARVRGEG